LLNARLSEKSAQGYNKVKGLTKGMLQGLEQLLAQDQATQQRFIQLGIPPQKTQVLGSVKFDISAPQPVIDQAQQLKSDWQLHTRKIITLASTHAPEEVNLLKELKSTLIADPSLVCIVVPRHPERFDEVFKAATELKLNTQRRSLGEKIAPSTQVYLADSMGEMWLWYALSQVCFVGGSLNEPGGGHNILEPIALNVATVLGKNYFNFQMIVDEFVMVNGVRVVNDFAMAAHVVFSLLQQQTQREALNLNAQTVMHKNKGALQRHIAILDQYVG
jgi:3-deoxy-D-manno-octulosonic-acid transferase